MESLIESLFSKIDLKGCIPIEKETMTRINTLPTFLKEISYELIPDIVAGTMKTKYSNLIPKKDMSKPAGPILLLLFKLYLDSIKTSKNLIKLFPNLKRLAETIYPKMNTRRGYYGKLRVLIKAKFGKEDPIYEKTFTDLSITKKEAGELTKQANLKVKKKNENQDEVDVSNVLKTLFKTYNSKSILDQIITVQLATGSRLIEVLKVSEYRRATDAEINKVKAGFKNVDYYIAIDGLAKAALKKDGTGKTFIVKPLVVLNPEQLIELVENIRSELGDFRNIGNTKLTATWNTQVNTNIRTYFPNASGSHFLRKIYGIYAYKAFAKNNTSLNAFLNNVLGHADDGISTSLNYSTIRLTRPDAFKEASNPKAEKQNQVLLESIARSEAVREQLEVQLRPRERGVRDGNKAVREVNRAVEVLQNPNELQEQYLKGKNEVKMYFLQKLMGMSGNISNQIWRAMNKRPLTPEEFIQRKDSIIERLQLARAR